MATELVRRPVAVIATTGGEPAVQAAKAATSTIPIVFATGVDPVKQGLVASFNRPGGNITGIVLFAAQLEPKRFGLLRDLAPQAPVRCLEGRSAQDGVCRWPERHHRISFSRRSIRSASCNRR